MTSRERLLVVLEGKIPDCVPVAPDISNMIPCRLTGKPFWDIYLYNDPPLWQAYIDAVKYFNIDSLMDGYLNVTFDGLDEGNNDWIEVIILKESERIVTQKYRKRLNGLEWSDQVSVFPISAPPWVLPPKKIGLPKIPSKFKKIEGKKNWDPGPETLKIAKEMLGDSGLIGVYCGTTALVHNEETIFRYYDDPGFFYDLRDRMLDYVEKRFRKIMELPDDTKPDFIATGASGTLVFQTESMFRELGLPIVKKITRLAKENNMFSHIHSCGPEKKLVKICHDETDLTVIDPLEITPMGDCNLKELKELYGKRLVLKGNLHTTNVMLKGTVEDVINASKQAIDDAADNGRFILSTGDQCGRDTPFENIYAMIETARNYGTYRR